MLLYRVGSQTTNSYVEYTVKCQEFAWNIRYFQEKLVSSYRLLGFTTFPIHFTQQYFQPEPRGEVGVISNFPPSF